MIDNTLYVHVPDGYVIDAAGAFSGVHRDAVPEIKAEIVGGWKIKRVIRDPMDTPRQIGFRASHKEN